METKSIEERAKAWIKSKDTAAMILDHHGVSGAAMAIYMQAANEQDRIARVEERERCIKEFCKTCYFNKSDGCSGNGNCDHLRRLLKAIEEGGNQ